MNGDDHIPGNDPVGRFVFGIIVALATVACSATCLTFILGLNH